MVKQCPRCGQWKEQGQRLHVQERVTPYRLDNHFLCVDCEKELEKWFKRGKENGNDTGTDGLEAP